MGSGIHRSRTRAFNHPRTSRHRHRIRRCRSQLLSDGRPTLVSSDQAAVEEIAVDIVRTEGIRARDGLHIAAARLIKADVAGDSDSFVFCSGDATQKCAAQSAGFAVE
jgi:hypothetical protein